MIQSSDALGHDLVGRAIGRSSFSRSISDGDVIGKGKAGTRIATSPIAWTILNFSKGGKYGSTLEHRKRESTNQG